MGPRYEGAGEGRGCKGRVGMVKNALVGIKGGFLGQAEECDGTELHCGGGLWEAVLTRRAGALPPCHHARGRRQHSSTLLSLQLHASSYGWYFSWLVFLFHSSKQRKLTKYFKLFLTL